MQRVADDDEQALAALVAALGPALLGFARRSLGTSGHEAEDVVQETFVRLWRARHRWQPTATVQTYLFTIAGRLCLNRHRGWRRRPPGLPLVDDEGVSRPIPDPRPDPERLAASAQLRDAMTRELRALPANQRTALLLKLVGGLRYDEIAVALDTTAAAVESLLSRARARLRPNLAPFAGEGKPPSRG
ncbi:MAG TPA: RNA polymerase sigma factor [Thermoanaerobaculaceae bacterium]|nr:RNA polymerase sigma factor [Thermoanaerobaculaceae bacterium]HPS78326.1 RNA polymerase sigma factor [Thermoanaerobaculaceae bacterium]